MDSFFGVGLAIGLIVGLVFLIPAMFILVVAFVYVRQHRGQPVDINTGASAYAIFLIALGALLITIGAAQLLTAIMAEIDDDYTYGAAFPGFDQDFGDGGTVDDFGQDTDDRQERDVATGFALILAGGLAVAAHLWLRGWLQGQARFDRGVEGAWDVLFTLVLGLTAIVLVGQMFDETFTRAFTDDDSNAAGSTIAQMVAVLGLWAVYGYRALSHVGMFVRNAQGGPGGGEPL